MNDTPHPPRVPPPEAFPWGAGPGPAAGLAAHAGPAHAAHRPPLEPRELVRRWLLVLSLILFAVAVLTAFVAANQVIATWLRDQWVPVARTVLALVVAGLALAAVWRLTVKRS